MKHQELALPAGNSQVRDFALPAVAPAGRCRRWGPFHRSSQPAGSGWVQSASSLPYPFPPFLAYQQVRRTGMKQATHAEQPLYTFSPTESKRVQDASPFNLQGC